VSAGVDLMRRPRIGPWLIGLGIAVLVAGGVAATLLLTREADYAACPDAIPWDIARDYPGEFLEIRGPVVRGFTDPDSGAVFLDLGREYPDPERLSLVIVDPSNFPGDVASRYVDRLVCARGTVAEFEGAANVIVRDPSDLWEG
jgi:hypothetical protein